MRGAHPHSNPNSHQSHKGWGVGQVGRKGDPQSRRSRAARRKAHKAAEAAMRGLSSEDRGTPNHRVLTLREDFAFITPSKGPDGRHGTIDQDICDGIGQLHALGLLDGHGHDPQDLRDAGRSWRDGYLLLMKGSACKTSRFERADKSHAEPPYTRADEWWDRMDAALTGYERSVLEDLLIDPMIGVYSDGDETPWARSIIAESLLKRGRIVPSMRFPDANDWGRLAAAVRGLIILASAGRNRIAA